jgi:hypothetical protein
VNTVRQEEWSLADSHKPLTVDEILSGKRSTTN